MDPKPWWHPDNRTIMKKKNLWLSLGFLAFLTAFKSQLIAQKTQNTLLWKVSGKGMAKPSYLFGTMHVLCADDAHLSNGLRDVIHGVDEVYFEIDLSDMSGMLKAMKYMRMNDSKKLSDLLAPNDYTKVRDYFSKHGSAIPFSMLERFKPMLISGLLEEQSMGCKTTDGMELMIMKELKTGRRGDSSAQKIHGLETVEFQAGLFDSIPYEQQAKELLNYIDSADHYSKATSDLAEVYKQQDLDKIDALSQKEDAGMAGYMDLLLYGRNRKWVSILGGTLGDRSLLVAVGAAHLPGEQGVINLLRKQGYTVTPLKN